MVQKGIEKGKPLSFTHTQLKQSHISRFTKSLTVMAFTFATFSTNPLNHQFGMLVRARPLEGQYSALKSVPPIDTVEVYELRPMADGGFETVPVQTQPGPTLPSTNDPSVSQQITTQTGEQTTTQNTASSGTATNSNTGTEPYVATDSTADGAATPAANQSTSTASPTQSSTIGDTPQTAGTSDVGVDPCQPRQGNANPSTGVGTDTFNPNANTDYYTRGPGTSSSDPSLNSSNCGQGQTGTTASSSLGGMVDGSITGYPGGGGIGSGMVNPYVTLGLFAYELVIGSQPKVLANTNKGVSVLPIATNQWAKMTGWTGPHTKTYQILYKSLGGKMTAVTFIFQVNYYANGNLGNKGKYLANVMVIPKKVDVSWGYSFDANFAAGDTINMGTVDSPIPGVHFQIQYRAHTILKRAQGITSFFVRGNGQLVQVE